VDHGAGYLLAIIIRSNFDVVFLGEQKVSLKKQIAKTAMEVTVVYI